MKLPDYPSYSFRELYEALEALQSDLYPEVRQALEEEIRQRTDVDKPLLEEVYFKLDHQRFPEHRAQLRQRIEALGGFDSIAPETVTDENLFKTGWRRVWALFFDVVIISVAFIPLSAVVLSGKDDDLAFQGAFEYILRVLSLFYFVLMHAAFGQTLGKMLTGVRVVKNADLTPINLRHALIRDIVPLMFIFAALIALPLFDFKIDEGGDAILKLPLIFLVIAIVELAWPILELLSMLFNRRRRAIHDFIAGTVVIRYLRLSDQPVLTKQKPA